MRVLSLGWGVQSFTLAAMAALGEMERLDVAIHADTGYERAATYEFAEKWTPWLFDHDVAVETVRPSERKRDVAVWLERSQQWSVLIPLYVSTGRTHRECTKEWKLRPQARMIRTLRNLHQVPAGEPTEQWIGISADEFQRASDARVKYIVNRFPLLERNMTREDCKRWLIAHDLPVPPKASCVMCPFHDSRSWQAMKRAGGGDWSQAMAIDERIREMRPGRSGGQKAYVHRAMVPLADAVDIPEDHGCVQTGFDPEGRCDEGMCWV